MAEKPHHKQPFAVFGIVVALVGALAALIVVPEVRQSLELDATRPLYEENFEDSSAEGWRFFDGNWTVEDDGTGNKVLNALATGFVNPYATVGTPAWIDYSVEFRVNFGVRTPATPPRGVEFQIRNATTDDFMQGGYVFHLYNLWGSAVRVENRWLGINTVPAPRLATDTWYPVKLEVQGNLIRGMVADMWLRDRVDDRFGRGGLAIILQPEQKTPVYFDDFRVVPLSS